MAKPIRNIVCPKPMGQSPSPDGEGWERKIRKAEAFILIRLTQPSHTGNKTSDQAVARSSCGAASSSLPAAAISL